MFAAGRHPENGLCRTIGFVIAIIITEDQQAVVAGTQQVRSHEVHSLRAGLRTVGKLNVVIGFAVVVFVNKNSNVAGAGNHDTSFRIDRHAMDVVRKIIICKVFHTESCRNKNRRRRRLGGLGIRERRCGNRKYDDQPGGQPLQSRLQHFENSILGGQRQCDE